MNYFVLSAVSVNNSFSPGF